MERRRAGAGTDAIGNPEPDAEDLRQYCIDPAAF